jgi:hypothetical protein
MAGVRGRQSAREWLGSRVRRGSELGGHNQNVREHSQNAAKLGWSRWTDGQADRWMDKQTDGHIRGWMAG